MHYCTDELQQQWTAMNTSIAQHKIWRSEISYLVHNADLQNNVHADRTPDVYIVLKMCIVGHDI